MMADDDISQGRHKPLHNLHNSSWTVCYRDDVITHQLWAHQVQQHKPTYLWTPPQNPGVTARGVYVWAHSGYVCLPGWPSGEGWSYKKLRTPIRDHSLFSWDGGGVMIIKIAGENSSKVRLYLGQASRKNINTPQPHQLDKTQRWVILLNIRLAFGDYMAIYMSILSVINYKYNSYPSPLEVDGYNIYPLKVIPTWIPSQC